MKLGKTLILGDSYSTFEGYILKGYSFWYKCHGSDDTNVLWLLNTDMDEKFPNAVKKIANHFGQKCIEFKKIDKLSGHPSINGMTQIANTIKEH